MLIGTFLPCLPACLPSLGLGSALEKLTHCPTVVPVFPGSSPAAPSQNPKAKTEALAGMSSEADARLAARVTSGILTQLDSGHKWR